MSKLSQLKEEIHVFNDDTGEELDLRQILDDLDDEETEENPFTRQFDDPLENDDEMSEEEYQALLQGYGEKEEAPEGQLELPPEEAESDADVNFTDPEEDPELEGELGTNEDEPQEDPDYQGTIRTVKGAYLVYKRQTPEGDFEELWLYNIGKDIKQETATRRAILAGTDIDPNRQQSEDGRQAAKTTSAGNVQFLHITGLPN